MEIIFTKTLEVTDEFYPQPASKFIPDWYKELPSYFNNNKEPLDNGAPVGTLKKCLPVFDSICAGYIITSSYDVWVKQKETDDLGKQPYYTWPTGLGIEFHDVQQAPNHPKRNIDVAYPKWINPWAIQTPKGYSCMFFQPVHRESIFEIFPGVVDTDLWPVSVNFPFVLKDKNFEGLIPAGTPIAQLVPFKRDSWEMRLGGKTDFENAEKALSRKMTRFYEYYKNFARSKKEYK